ncbi:MAG TPA: radical SAM protein [Myxococcales bacterium]|jgi:anaerobic magnesium-protoporphyrin IX monomethyl ester cyclase
MRVLFVTPPYHCGVVEAAGRWIPLQFVYLAGAVRAAGFDCEIYDAMSLGVDHAAIERKLDEARPDVVCISAITSTFPDSAVVAQAAKARGATTVLGGVHPSFMHQEVLAGGGVDFVVVGEGESALVDLLRCLQAKDDPKKVAGLAFLSDGKPVRTAGRPRLDALDPMPMAWDLLDWKTYTLFVQPGSRLAAVSTSRGCMYACSFCSQTQFWEKTWRARSPECVANEIAALKKDFGVTVVLLTDEYPTGERERWQRLMQRLVEMDLGVDLLLETRAQDIVRDEDLLPLYRKAGVLHVYIGIEATDQATLDFVNKESSVDAGKRALELLRQHGFISETSFVLGFPNETPEHVKETLRLSKLYDPDFAHYLAIAPWPYAPLGKELDSKIATRDYRKYNLIDPVIKPDAMSLADIDRAIAECYRGFYMDKALEFVKLPPGPRRDYLLTSTKIIMGTSFVKSKMAAAGGMPEDVKRMLAHLGR